MSAREKPIIFCGDMVRAILKGRKGNTRRVILPQPYQGRTDDLWSWDGKRKCRGTTRMLLVENIIAYAPYQVGDLLWVRERQRVIEICIRKLGLGMKIRVCYEADGAESDWLVYPDRLIHVPRCEHCLPYGGYRESARLWLRVTSVRAERVRDISTTDCIAEGLEATPDVWSRWVCLWDSLNYKRGYGYSRNPWVWVYTFTRTEAQR